MINFMFNLLLLIDIYLYLINVAINAFTICKV